MKVTNVKLFKSTLGKTKAYGNVELDGEMIINVSIFESKDGPFVSWPSYKSNKDNQWHSQVRFTKEKQAVRDEVCSVILSEYATMISADQTAPAPPTGSSDPSGVAPF